MELRHEFYLLTNQKVFFITHKAEIVNVTPSHSLLKTRMHVGTLQDISGFEIFLLQTVTSSYAGIQGVF